MSETNNQRLPRSKYLNGRSEPRYEPDYATRNMEKFTNASFDYPELDETNCAPGTLAYLEGTVKTIEEAKRIDDQSQGAGSIKK